MAYHFENIKLEKGMYQEAGRSFTQVLERLDPSEQYKGTGMEGLDAMQNGARAVLNAGGCATLAGQQALARLDRQMLALNASPGGAADLLAATLFLDRVETPNSKH